MKRILVRIYLAIYSRRHMCRERMSAYGWMFAALVVLSPYVIANGSTTTAPPPEVTIFNLHPDAVKFIWNGLFVVASGLIIRALNNVLKALNNLHSNQRELAKVLTQLTTAHGINHGQVIAPPDLVGGDGNTL